MKPAIILICFCAFAGCSTPKHLVSQTSLPPPPPQQLPEHPLVSTKYVSPDGQLVLKFRHTKKPFSYQLINRNTRRVLATARTSLQPHNIDGERIRSTIDVAFASDQSGVLIHDDHSDASPNPFYILIQRKGNSSSYRVLYLAPPTEHISTLGEFDFLYPSIRSLSRNEVTFYYWAENCTRSIPLTYLLKTSELRGAEQWPSDEIKARYKQ